MLRLHVAPNTISIASVIALYEAQVHFELVWVDFAKGEQSGPDYARINPKARVPALETPQGILTETGAILEYVAQTLAPGLAPADAMQAARMREVMYYLASTMHVNHAHRMRGHRWADKPESHADMAQKVAKNMSGCAQYIEGLIEGPLLFGDQPTLADFYLFAISSWLEADSVDIRETPRLAQHFDAMRTRPSVQRTIDVGVLPGL